MNSPSSDSPPGWHQRACRDGIRTLHKIQMADWAEVGIRMAQCLHAAAVVLHVVVLQVVLLQWYMP